MRRYNFRFVPAMLAVALTVALVGCQGDRERSAQSLQTYAEAVVVHRAAFQAYALLDTSDKRFQAMEGWAGSFDQTQPTYPAGTTVAVSDVVVKGDVATADVTITPPGADPVVEEYVLRREGTKWRVWLGLDVLAQQRTTLDEARQLAQEGALDLAREKVETVIQASFPASRPAVIEGEVLTLRQKLSDDQRFARLDARFDAAMQADLPTMTTELEELTKLVTADDETLFPRLGALQVELERLRKQAAIDNFVFEEVRARAVRDRWGTFHEVQFTTKNGTGRPLSQLSVRVSFLNEGTDTPLGSAVWELIEAEATVPVDDTLKVKREVAKAPEDWDGKHVNLDVEELAFADGDPDDAG